MEKISTNLTIKLYHSEACSEAQMRANANELARRLSPLAGAWAISRTGAHEIAAFCSVSASEAIVVPSLPEVRNVRVQPARSKVDLASAMILWQ